MGIATQILEKVLKPIDTKLSKTTKLIDLPEDKRADFEELYSHSTLAGRFLGVILNGIYTEGKTEFLMSLPLFRKLLLADSDNGNIVRKTVNDKEYRLFAASMYKNQLVHIVERSKKKSFEYPVGRAGTWRIVDDGCLKLVSNKFIESELIFKYKCASLPSDSSLSEFDQQTTYKIY